MHSNRCPLPTLPLSSQKSDIPASEPFIYKETVEHITNCEFLLKIYHIFSFWKSLLSTKLTPTLSAIFRTNHIRSRLAFMRTSRETYFRLKANHKAWTGSVPLCPSCSLVTNLIYCRYKVTNFLIHVIMRANSLKM